MEEIIGDFGTYVIYKISSHDKDFEYFNFYMCVPYGKCDEFQMYIGLPQKDLQVLNTSEVIQEVRNVYEVIKSKDIIYILPDISINILTEISHNNDDREYNRLLQRRIHPVTMQVYKMFNGKINEKINFIKQDSNSIKFINWLVIQYAKINNNFIGEVNFNELKKVSNDDGGTSMVNSGGEVENTKQDVKRKTYKPKKSPMAGFSTFRFIAIVLILSIIVGVSIGYLLAREKFPYLQ